MVQERFTGNAFKYNEGELITRYIGKYIDGGYDPDSSAKYKQKKATYTNEGVWGDFTALRDSFRGLLVDYTIKKDGYVDQDMCNKASQLMIDSFLIRRSRGENVSVPRQVVPVNAAPDGSTVELIDGGGFSDRNASENEKLRWIFENMQVDGLVPESAPSAGAWALLQELRKDGDQRRDFYKTLWPKLLTKEESDGGSRLQDDGKEVIDLIKRLIAALPVESEE